MLNRLVKTLSNWKAHPKRFDVSFISEVAEHKYQAARDRKRLLQPPIDTKNVAVLSDSDFCRSIARVKDYTLLDVARLANLWYLAKLVGEGVFLEAGSYRGGSALHICNAIEDRPISFYCFDQFERGGFEKITRRDGLFHTDDFRDTQYEAVVKLLSCKPNAKVIQGFFPEAAAGLELQRIAFCHLDIDVYEATRDSLEYLSGRLAPRSLIVLDDVNRKVEGVDAAIAEFLVDHPSFLFIPIFPSQGVLLSKALW